MYFYEIRVKTKSGQWFSESQDRRKEKDIAYEIQDKSEQYFYHIENYCFWVKTIKRDIVSVGAIFVDKNITNELVEAYLKNLGIENVENVSIKEVTFNDSANSLNQADRIGYISDDGIVLEKFGIGKLCPNYGRDIEFKEYLATETTKEKVYEVARDTFVDKTMINEADRIFERGKGTLNYGHPVHYMISTAIVENQNQIIKVLMDALYTNKRVSSRRYSVVSISEDNRIRENELSALYKLNTGGAIIVKNDIEKNEDDDLAGAALSSIEKISVFAKKYSNDVLTIFVFKKHSERNKKVLLEKLDKISFVEIFDNYVNAEETLNYLKGMAEEKQVEVDEDLLNRIEAGENYYGFEIKNIFYDWYNQILKTKLYPQYETVTMVGKQEEKELRGNAYDELQEMIGLSEAKKVINKAIKYYKAQKIFADKGMKEERASMHMVFTGNPGTAKTTVARLFSKIMRDNGILEYGHIVEVGRSDLVGKYVGWTAPIIKKKFRQAMGGVLFIDEAYSLVDDRDGSFGDEAINTIVQEMENHREDVVVIFAGYPDEMEKFLKKNPGLRSRIAFHVPFADYNPDELCEIAKLIAENKGVTLTDNALTKLYDNFQNAVCRTDFGNGRYVRNAIEKAKMSLAARLVDSDYDKLKKKDIVTISEEDIEVDYVNENETRKIGFAY